MKKETRIYLIFSLAITGLLFLEFQYPGFDHSSTEVQAIPDIKSVKVNLPCNIFIQQNDEQKLIIENKQSFNQISTKIENGVLKINNSLFGTLLHLLNIKNKDTSNINIYISLKNIQNLQVCKFCRDYIDGSINQDRLNLSVKGPKALIYIDTKEAHT